MPRKSILCSIAAALLLSAPCLADTKLAKFEEQQAVEQAAARFYASLNALFIGQTEGMFQIWSHADDVTYMGPAGGFQTGWENVWANWEKCAAKKLGGIVEPKDMHVVISGDLAVVQCYERGNNQTPDLQSLNVNIRATSVFRKENGEWKMITHHTDLLPFLVDQPSNVGTATSETESAD